MSKTTKIIAALGVVAGLGVAALPAFTYATNPASTTGNVEVDVEVLPAIAMTISGNNDNGEHYNPAGATYTYTAVTGPEGNPSAQGWYEEDGGEYTLSGDTTVDSGKTYYKRTSNYFNPVDSFNPTDAHDSTIDGHPTPAASITALSSSYTSLLPNSIVNGSAGNGFRSTITVYTNANAGYTLSVKDTDSTLALTQITTGTPDTIPAAASISAGANAGWNFDVTRLGTEEGGTWAPTATGTDTDELTAQVISATDAQIDSLPTKTSGGRVTVVDYNVATRADQSTGIYTDTIIYTATTN